MVALADSQSLVFGCIPIFCWVFLSIKFKFVPRSWSVCLESCIATQAQFPVNSKNKIRCEMQQVSPEIDLKSSRQRIYFFVNERGSTPKMSQMIPGIKRYQVLKKASSGSRRHIK